ncbi:MAG: alpha/beta hydrolase [Verrucomicrobiota bacterium]
MMKFLSFAAVLVGLTVFALGQPQDPIPLWPGAVPGALGTDPVKDIPTLTPFWPAPGKAVSGAAMVICPGGGYGGLAAHEGRDYALWLNERGIVAFVLKYRLGTNGYRHPAMMNDVQRAIRLVRYHAEGWKINPEKIGVMGSSAGGHLASTALTHFGPSPVDAADPVDTYNSRPDLGILCYPVISMGPLTHGGSKKNLLGDNPPEDLVALLSNELQVTKNTPPCFIWHTGDDPVVPVRNSLGFADALLKNGVPFDLHIYQHGAHGLGLGVRVYEPGKTDPAKMLPWTHDLESWLKLQGFVN